VNLPNRGQIPNLPSGAVVESYSTIDRTGVRPEMLAPLPPGPAAVCASHLAEQELTVDAAIHGNRRKALRALCMDPAITLWSVAAPLLDEMLQATKACLPQFHCAMTRPTIRDIARRAGVSAAGTPAEAGARLARRSRKADNR
jgi:alpha-galactosidase/6-phospho-beta-glucosidase family protein